MIKFLRLGFEVDDESHPILSVLKVMTKLLNCHDNCSFPGETLEGRFKRVG